MTSAISFLSSGLFQGFRSIGTRIKAAHYKPVMEAFCACAGRAAAENGRLKSAEMTAFRRFVLEQNDHPVIKTFSPDELTEKFKAYAIHAFLEEEEIFIRVLDPIEPGSEAAQMIVMGCLAVAFADGVCDTGERLMLETLASRLGIKTDVLVQTLGVELPPVARASRLGRAVQRASLDAPQRPTDVREMCTLCQGKGCVFCQDTGFKR